MAINRKYRLGFIAAFMYIACITPTFAGSRDTARIEHLSIWNQLSAQTILNPALHADAYHTSYSQMALQYDNQRQTQAFVQEDGSGHTMGSLFVDSYLRMNNHTAVWGGASYTAGTQRNICWNSTSDYNLLAPYVMADTLGGNTYRERYYFTGGYGTQLNRIHLGGEIAIRAEHEYRDRDPRMRGIVTELTLRGGAAVTAWGYKWGAVIGGTVYKQTNSVDFYNELGKIPEFHLTGLGTDYSRFSGEQTEVAYQGGSFGIAIDANPIDHSGLYGHAYVGRKSYERQLTSANSVPLSQLVYNNIEAILGWKHNGEHRWAIHADFNFTKRSGDENITGKSDSQYYPVIGRLTMYKNWLTNISLGGMYGIAKGSMAKTISLKAGYRNHRENYVYPERILNRAHTYVTAQGEWSKELSQRLALTLHADASHYAPVDSKIVMPYANMTKATTEMINYKYRFAKAAYTNANIKVRGDYSLNASPIGLFAEVTTGLTFCSENEQQTAVMVTAGVTF